MDPQACEVPLQGHQREGERDSFCPHRALSRVGQVKVPWTLELKNYVVYEVRGGHLLRRLAKLKTVDERTAGVVVQSHLLCTSTRDGHLLCARIGDSHLLCARIGDSHLLCASSVDSPLLCTSSGDRVTFGAPAVGTVTCAPGVKTESPSVHQRWRPPGSHLRAGDARCQAQSST